MKNLKRMIPLSIIDWSTEVTVQLNGLTGFALSKELPFQGLKIRQVQYSPNYTSDHWCSSGHVVYCLEGEFALELNTGEKHVLKKGMSFLVSNDLSVHKLSSKEGALVFIVDGEILE